MVWVTIRRRSSSMWRGVTGSLGSCGGGGHRWDSSGVPVVFLGGVAVECGGDDVLCLAL